MVHVRKIKIQNQTNDFWIVVGNDYLPVREIDLYLRYLLATGKSPNTIRSYAYHLKEFWDFLGAENKSFADIGLVEMSQFINWLKHGYASNIISIAVSTSLRSDRTINTIVTAVISFYEYISKIDSINSPNVFSSSRFRGKSYKPFLHHISKGEAIKKNILKIKEPKTIPKTLTKDQIKVLIENSGNKRDKFLICLLYETGMRIGEALGLRHEDIQSWDKVINITPRRDNINKARVKGYGHRKVDISSDLIHLYSACQKTP